MTVNMPRSLSGLAHGLIENLLPTRLLAGKPAESGWKMALATNELTVLSGFHLHWYLSLGGWFS